MTSSPRMPKPEVGGVYRARVKRFSRQRLGEVPDFGRGDVAQPRMKLARLDTETLLSRSQGRETCADRTASASRTIIADTLQGEPS